VRLGPLRVQTRVNPGPPRQNGLHGQARAPGWAAQGDAKGHGAQAGRQGLDLQAPVAGQRAVAEALVAPLQIGAGLTVAHEPDAGSHAGAPPDKRGCAA